MLWLDSAYPLDKPTTDPGIKRGDCPGGETSTPTYLRQKYPNGGVIFKNAAVGEIGSTYVPPPPTQPPVPTQPPAPSKKPTPSPVGQQCETSGCCSQDFASCVTWCGSTKNECLSCGQEVGWICGEQTGCKPRWGDCTNDQNGCCDGLTCVTVNPGYSQCRIADPTQKPSPAPSPRPTVKPTPIPTEIRLPTTSSPTFSLSPTNEGCFSNNYKDCLPKSQLDGPASCDTVWLPNGPQQGCVALWGDCTDDSSSCCGDAVCFGDAAHAVCVPPADSTDSPTPKPTIPEHSSKPTTLKPTNAPTNGGPPACSSEYQDCTNSASSCCEGYKVWLHCQLVSILFLSSVSFKYQHTFKCVQYDVMGNSKCLADTCDEGVLTSCPTFWFPKILLTHLTFLCLLNKAHLQVHRVRPALNQLKGKTQFFRV